MSGGGQRRRDLGWWKRHGRRTKLDPTCITIRGGDFDRRAIERYRRNPASPLFGTPVCVVKLTGGGYFAREGAHRITAARLEGRKIKVLLVSERDEQGAR